MPAEGFSVPIVSGKLNETEPSIENSTNDYPAATQPSIAVNEPGATEPSIPIAAPAPTEPAIILDGSIDRSKEVD
jgi:hypothetical protein